MRVIDYGFYRTVTDNSRAGALNLSCEAKSRRSWRQGVQILVGLREKCLSDGSPRTNDESWIRR